MLLSPWCRNRFSTVRGQRGCFPTGSPASPRHPKPCSLPNLQICHGCAAQLQPPAPNDPVAGDADGWEPVPPHWTSTSVMPPDINPSWSLAYPYSSWCSFTRSVTRIGFISPNGPVPPLLSRECERLVRLFKCGGGKNADEAPCVKQRKGRCHKFIKVVRRLQSRRQEMKLSKDENLKET